MLRGRMLPPLLIFDLDETLVYSTEEPLSRPPDFRVGPYACYRRPGVDGLLAVALEHFRVAVWSTSSAPYARAVAQTLFETRGGLDSLEFVWGRPRCDKTLHPTLGVEIWIKDLSRLEPEGYPLERALIVDDSPEKVCRQPRNLLPVSLYFGADQSDELRRLTQVLPSLVDADDVRELALADWRSRIPS